MLMLVVGLAVDYCVHLAEAYCRSPHPLRKGRLHDALEHVGVSVLSGFTLSFGSAACLLACDIVVLSRFGALICFTTSMSVIFTFYFFATLMGIIGPEYDRGSLKPIFDRFYAKYLEKQVEKYPIFIKPKKIRTIELHHIDSIVSAIPSSN